LNLCSLFKLNIIILNTKMEAAIVDYNDERVRNY